MRAKRLFARFEESLHEGFVDYGDVLRRRGVLFGDRAPAQDGLAERLQIAGIYMVPGRANLLIHVGHAVSLADHDLAPVVLQWRVLRQSGAVDAGNVRQPVLQLAIHRIQLWLWVRREGRREADGDAVVGLVTEILMLQVGKAMRQQAGTRQQDDGQCGLHDNQNLLREGGTVARGAIRAAQGLRRIGMRCQPRGRCTEEHAGDERERERECQNRQRGRGIDGHVFRAVKSECHNCLHAEIRNRKPGDSAEDGEHDTLRQAIAG